MAFVTVVVTAADSDPIRKSGLFLDILSELHYVRTVCQLVLVSLHVLAAVCMHCHSNLRRKKDRVFVIKILSS